MNLCPRLFTYEVRLIKKKQGVEGKIEKYSDGDYVTWPYFMITAKKLVFGTTVATPVNSGL